VCVMGIETILLIGIAYMLFKDKDKGKGGKDE
jgi:hypothetical protein